MRGFSNLYGSRKFKGASALALIIALANASGALAQTTATQDSSRQDAAEGTGDQSEVVVTGSRIERAGFNQPTPTTVIGDTELRLGARPNIQQVLNDSPQFRPTTTPQVSVGNTSSGTAPVDLRGLGSDRTLTLINGRRFVGANNLNFVPLGLVDRAEVVTGGASAAYGSGAVAGVVNIILKKNLEGLAVGASSGISSRGDGARYGADATYGTSFADGAGHFMIGAEYLDDKGISDRNSRKNLGSAALLALDPAFPKRQTRVRDVNTNPYGTYYTPGGLITSGVLAGQTFNQDGTLRPFDAPNARGVGGSDARGLYDDVAVALPVQRINAYARASYDVGGATFWIDGTYGRSHVNDGKFLPDYLASAPITISAANPFLSQAIRSRLTAAGQSGFTFMRDYNDIYNLQFDALRTTYEGAIGVDGKLGSGIKYAAHYSHGEVVATQRLKNATFFPQFNNAINAVRNASGNIVCAINADASTTNDDAACAPLNPFGPNNASAAALAYTRGTEYSHTVSKLDSADVHVQADLFSLWAGPITGLLGAEARWEEVVATNGALDKKAAFGGFSLYTSPVSGGFNVKEGYGELAVPVLDATAVKLDLNGAARYSDYSTSGGIWSWKYGGTVRFFGDLMLRATRSRDIRSPNVGDLFAVRSLSIGPVVDRDTANRPPTPPYNSAPTLVSTYRGGNPDLVPEIGKTLTFGGSYSPSFIPRLSVSVDYYDIKINGAIATLSGSDLSAACAAGNAAACDRVIRDPVSQTITQVFANAQNIASFKTRGIDFEASYLVPLSQLSSHIPGSLRIRALATHVDRVIFSTGAATPINVAGDVGETVTNGTPKWRGTLSFSYQTDRLGLDARVRYVGGGKFNQLLDGRIPSPGAPANVTLLNNDISARTYVDLGAQFKVNDRFTFFGNIANLFDRDPPISTAGPIHYDAIGTYFTFGARVKF
ncbi:TonB-dependent receptor plug domain-containing protein [Sphingomonas crusticola]|uniref:TonB-dependent receptor plug domain-containing protein n=1 Tax=Sphingomonas crusticola TaxID=1697973 RepID=UPI000E24E1BB|nr:TonB-dependent receptor [Sphingomonas crusticola]